MPRRVLVSFLRSAGLPSGPASRLKLACFEDAHALALMLLDAAASGMDAGACTVH